MKMVSFNIVCCMPCCEVVLHATWHYVIRFVKIHRAIRCHELKLHESSGFDMAPYDTIWYDMIWHLMLHYERIRYELWEASSEMQEKRWHDIAYAPFCDCIATSTCYDTLCLGMARYVLMWHAIHRESVAGKILKRTSNWCPYVPWAELSQASYAESLETYL